MEETNEHTESVWQLREQLTALQQKSSEQEAEETRLRALLNTAWTDLDAARRETAMAQETSTTLAGQLTRTRDAIWEATVEAISGGAGACYPGARDLLETCGVPIPVEEHTYNVVCSFTGNATVAVEVEVDALDAMDPEHTPDDLDLDAIARSVVDAVEGGNVHYVDRYSVEVEEAERA